ncbi:proline dehydrogenase family protein [Streptomyces sp. NPDC048506]|uniref:proline dehydrogenase family protein n=1 Tax=Streptomyces sp. NPDC048506 TaxID=3155028 RepID=UPI003433C9A5
MTESRTYSLSATDVQPEPEAQLLRAAGQGLRMLAADGPLRLAFSAPESPLRAALAPAAYRYLVADDRAGLLKRLQLLRQKRYQVSVEFVGEEITDPAEIEQVVEEYLALIEEDPEPAQLGFDLSNLGLLVSRDLAVRNTLRVLRAAATHGAEVLISMERSEFVDEVLGVFTELAETEANVGITLQAHLHRTEEDLDRILPLGRKIRLVKGVYAEPAAVALPRGPELDERYLALAARAVGHGARTALATHDSRILAAADERGLLDGAEEIEMLHGVQPGLLKHYHDAGRTCRVYATYGQNWWLHFLHRLAEHPPMALTALADLANGGRAEVGANDY